LHRIARAAAAIAAAQRLRWTGEVRPGAEDVVTVVRMPRPGSDRFIPQRQAHYALEYACGASGTMRRRAAAQNYACRATSRQ